jgi:hypothetical protein
MDFDICFLCHSHIDFTKLDEAYPHLSEEVDTFPPQGLTPLEENIYWGAICVDCAQAAEAPPPERAPFRNFSAVQREAESTIFFPGNS